MVVSVFLCVFGCKIRVSDQIQEIAAAYVSCHTVRDREGERKRWKERMLRVSKRKKALMMKEIQHGDRVYTVTLTSLACHGREQNGKLKHRSPNSHILSLWAAQNSEITEQ